jgi:hypothetical protein
LGVVKIRDEYSWHSARIYYPSTSSGPQKYIFMFSLANN